MAITETGLTLDKQVDIIGDVVHQNSRNLDELVSRYEKSCELYNANIDVLNGDLDYIDGKLTAIDHDIFGLSFWTATAVTALCFGGYFGYKAWKKHEERIENLEELSKKDKKNKKNEKVDDVIIDVEVEEIG